MRRFPPVMNGAPGICCLHRCAVLLLAVAAAAGCASTHVALSDAAAGRIHTVKVISAIPQATVATTRMPLGREALPAGEDIIPGADGGTFRRAFAEGLVHAADGSDRLIFQEIDSFDHPFTASERPEQLTLMKTDALLVLTTDYYLSPDFRVLNVRSRAQMWARDGETLYRGQWEVHSAPQIGAHDDAVIAAWSANHAAAYLKAEQAAVEATELMAHVVLSGRPVRASLGMQPVTYAEADHGRTVEVDGRVLLREQGWTIIRDAAGDLHAVPSLEEKAGPASAGSAPVQGHGAP